MSRGKTENLFFTSELSLLRDRWQRTKDDETLAQIVELAPPGGDAEIGKAIAKKLRVKRPDKKAENDVMWREIDRLWRILTIQNGQTQKQAYEQIKQIYFAEKDDEKSGELYDLRTIERQHRRWAKKAK
jgi:hypothetical protein